LKGPGRSEGGSGEKRAGIENLNAQLKEIARGGEIGLDISRNSADSSVVFDRLVEDVI